MVLFHDQHPRRSGKGYGPIIILNPFTNTQAADFPRPVFFPPHPHPFSQKAEGRKFPPRIPPPQPSAHTRAHPTHARLLGSPEVYAYCSTVVLQGADGMPLAITVNVLGPNSVPANTSNSVLVSRLPVATAMVLGLWLRAKK